jgi:thiol:disulfide interchange protein DsbD
LSPCTLSKRLDTLIAKGLVLRGASAAGLSVLPKPGNWMVWVKRGFALVFLAMAVWYGAQAAGRMENAERKTENEVRKSRVDGSGTTSDVGTRPVFIKIGAPWCRNCASMARTTFRDPDVIRELSAYEVREIEIDSFSDLAKHSEISGLDIKGLPAYVIIDKDKAKENRK